MSIISIIILLCNLVKIIYVYRITTFSEEYSNSINIASNNQDYSTDIVINLDYSLNQEHINTPNETIEDNKDILYKEFFDNDIQLNNIDSYSIYQGELTSIEIEKIINYWVDFRIKILNIVHLNEDGTNPREVNNTYTDANNNLENEYNDEFSLEKHKFDRQVWNAAVLFVKRQEASILLMQNELQIDKSLAVRIISQLETNNIVGPSTGGSKSRTVLVHSLEHLDHIFSFPNHSSIPEDLKELEDYIFTLKKQYECIIEKRIDDKIEEIGTENRKRLKKKEIREKILDRQKKSLGKAAENELYNQIFKEMVNNNEIDENFVTFSNNREMIPTDIMDAVWRRDGGKCVECGSDDSLEFDHIIPFSLGGATSYRNLQILCKKCNIKKSNHIG